MKRIIIFTLLSAATIFTISAQDQNQLRAFTFGSFGSNLAVGDEGFKTGLGLTGGLEYFVVDNISANLSYTHYFKTHGNEIIFGSGSTNWWLTAKYLSLDGKYYPEIDISWLQPYGLVGFTHYQSDYRVQGTTGRPVFKKVGMNFGAGAIILMDDFWNIMAELKYATPGGAVDTPSGGRTIASIGILWIFD